MKILHTAVMSELMTGVLRQMEAEQLSADKLGLQWKASYFLGEPVDSPIVTVSPVSSKNRIKYKLAYYKWLISESKQYDVILLRYCTFDPMQLIFLLMCRKPIYSVHHTLEVPELTARKENASGSKFAIRLKILAEKILGSLSLSLVDGIIGVMEEITEYNVNRRLIKKQIPWTVYSNGIDFYSDTSYLSQSAGKKREQDVSSESKPVFLFVSSVFGPWQGLEELVEAAYSYEGEFICHVVGDVSSDQRTMLEKDTRFVVHGRLNGDEIAELIRQSDIGLSILAAYKKRMKNIPALKVREYLKEGLAVYAGHGDVMPEDFKYYRQGSIDIEAIVKFAIENRMNDRAVISQSARPFIEKEVLVSHVYEFLLEDQKTGK